MKTLSQYERNIEPKILRDDLVKDNRGIAYNGSKLREINVLFPPQHYKNNSSIVVNSIKA